MQSIESVDQIYLKHLDLSKIIFQCNNKNSNNKNSDDKDFNNKDSDDKNIPQYPYNNSHISSSNSSYAQIN